MRKQIIVTIGRSFGSNGRQIGETLAQDIGIAFYDRNLLKVAADKAGIPERKLAGGDEKLFRWFHDLGIDNSTDNANEQVFRMQSAAIRDIVRSGESCVFVGRLADYVLRNRPDVLKVYIYAPMEQRIETVMERYEFKREEAMKVIRHMDKTRQQYYEYFTDRPWDQKEGKNLLIDSSLFGVEGSVEIIKSAIRQNQFIEEVYDEE